MELQKTGNEISEPMSDDELPLITHLAELRRRLIVVLIPFAAVTLIMFPFSNAYLHVLLTHLLPGDMSLFVYGPREWLSVRPMFSFLCALSVILPLLLYEIFAFMRPGLYPSERRFFLIVVIPSLCLYGLGAFFAYYIVLPRVFDYIIAYSGEVALVRLSAKRVFSIILYTAVGFGLIFQIPLIMALAVRMKLVTYSWLRGKRLIFYGLIIGIALFVIADPTGISMLMAVVSIAMFELGLLITRFYLKKKA